MIDCCCTSWIGTTKGEEWMRAGVAAIFWGFFCRQELSVLNFVAFFSLLNFIYLFD